ncbi:formylmethanofuran dehydrogenase subunit B [[Eubacterium] cellulosolvens]
MSKKTSENVICTFCASGCDDLEITHDRRHVYSARKGCAISLSRFANTEEDRVLKPLLRTKGTLRPTTFTRAIDRAARILSNSKYPLLYGWSQTSSEAISRGIELTELVGGLIDNTTTSCHGPTILGIQDVGEATCTLGEVRHSADLIIYWGCNPIHSHPHHINRFSVLSRGRFRKSRKDRKLVVVDVRRTDTAKLADQFIQVEPNCDYELLTALRTAINGEEIEQDSVAGVPSDTIEEIADMMTECEFGALFFGLGLTMTPGKHRNTEAALALVRDLNYQTKFVIIPMRGWFNVRGANEVSTWQTGYPYAVDLTQGYPRFNPGDTSAIDALSRGEVDAALVVASDPVSHLPKAAVKHLLEIPIVTVEPKRTPTSEASEVVIPSAIIGIETTGTIYRIDGVALEARKVIDPPQGVRPDVEILDAIIKRVKSLGVRH